MKRRLSARIGVGVMVFGLVALAPLAAQAPATDGDDVAEEQDATYTPTASAVPSTDIFVGTLELDARPAVVGLTNVTNRVGYDNQPFFTPDGAGILFTSGRSPEQTDIYRIDVASGRVLQVTDTPSSEYSPTVMPGGKSFSAIHEAEGGQHLWKFALDGTDQGALFPDVRPVGYQAWGDQNTVGVFVLGDESSPHTLQLIDTGTGAATVIEENIGRSLHKIPGAAAISFVHKLDEERNWWIKRLDLETAEISSLVETLPGEEDYAWTPKGTILMGAGSTLHEWKPGGEWAVIAELAATGIDGITRIAVSPEGDRIALVGSLPAE